MGESDMTRSSKFGVRGSENLELRTSDLEPSPVSLALTDRLC